MPRAVDTDLHTSVPTSAALASRLPRRWQEFLEVSPFRNFPGLGNAYPPGARATARDDATDYVRLDAPDALAKLQRNVLDASALQLAIVNCYCGLDSERNPDFQRAMMAAVDDWVVDEWLDRDPRLLGTLTISPMYPDYAAQEIKRKGSDPRVVQLMLPARSDVPYGNRKFDPLYRAAVEAGLVVAIHFGGMPGTPPTSVGWPQSYLQDYVGMTSAFAAQLASLVIEGAFERFPDLRVAMLESGWSWLPTLIWRLDAEWKGLRREAPWLKKPPSQYIREHVRLSLQPTDAPLNASAIASVIDRLGSQNLLMFSSDYPHRHVNDSQVFVDHLPVEMRDKVLATNAAQFYRIEAFAAAMSHSAR